MAHDQFGRVAVLLPRSFLISAAEEAVVLIFWLRTQRRPWLIFKAVAAANVASYLLLAVVIGLIGMSAIPWGRARGDGGIARGYRRPEVRPPAG